jgi:hypothetical protein
MAKNLSTLPALILRGKDNLTIIMNWKLELEFGIGSWNWKLEMEDGVGSWNWKLELDVVMGSWG